MIIFYNKKTGKIEGTIMGRLHAQHLDMWVGDPKETERIVVEWKQTGKKHYLIEERVEYEPVGIDEEGQDIYKKVMKKEKKTIREFEPSCKQKDLFRELDNKPLDVHNYKIDLKTKELIPNEQRK